MTTLFNTLSLPGTFGAVGTCQERRADRDQIVGRTYCDADVFRAARWRSRLRSAAGYHNARTRPSVLLIEDVARA